MAKISISIPDELKRQLDEHAAETGQKRSEAVAAILEAHFADLSREPEQNSQVENLKRQLEQVRSHLETLYSLDPDNRPRPEWMPEPGYRGFFRASE